jgi:hypothetical protein
MQESVQTLASLKDLDIIVLTVPPNVEDQKRKEIEEMVLEARVVLSASPSIKHKTLVVKRPDATEIT